MTVLALPVRPLATVQAEDAHRTAWNNRSSQADLVLSLGVTDALDLIREGRVGFAEYRLARSLVSAQRILGERAGR